MKICDIFIPNSVENLPSLRNQNPSKLYLLCSTAAILILSLLVVSCGAILFSPAFSSWTLGITLTLGFLVFGFVTAFSLYARFSYRKLSSKPSGPIEKSQIQTQKLQDKQWEAELSQLCLEGSFLPEITPICMRNGALNIEETIKAILKLDAASIALRFLERGAKYPNLFMHLIRSWKKLPEVELQSLCQDPLDADRLLMRLVKSSWFEPELIQFAYGCGALRESSSLLDEASFGAFCFRNGGFSYCLETPIKDVLFSWSQFKLLLSCSDPDLLFQKDSLLSYAWSPKFVENFLYRHLESLKARDFKDIINLQETKRAIQDFMTRYKGRIDYVKDLIFIWEYQPQENTRCFLSCKTYEERIFSSAHLVLEGIEEIFLKNKKNIEPYLESSIRELHSDFSLLVCQKIGFFERLRKFSSRTFWLWAKILHHLCDAFLVGRDREYFYLSCLGFNAFLEAFSGPFRDGVMQVLKFRSGESMREWIDRVHRLAKENISLKSLQTLIRLPDIPLQIWLSHLPLFSDLPLYNDLNKFFDLQG